MDGASTDGTLEYIQKLSRKYDGTDGRRHVVWTSSPDRGLYDALNKAVRMASGAYLIVANDLLAKRNSLSKLTRALEGAGACGAHADLVYADHIEGKTVIRRRWHMGNSHRIFTGWMPGHPSLLLKREIYEAYGKYKTDYRIAADYEFMMRFLKDRQNRLAYVPEVLVQMYYGGTSTARFSDYVDSFREGYRALRENNIPFPFLTTCFRTVRVLLQFLPVRMPG